MRYDTCATIILTPALRQVVVNKDVEGPRFLAPSPREVRVLEVIDEVFVAGSRFTEVVEQLLNFYPGQRPNQGLNTIGGGAGGEVKGANADFSLRGLFKAESRAVVFVGIQNEVLQESVDIGPHLLSCRYGGKLRVFVGHVC